MDAALKQKWVAALRGGEYEQARCVLYHQDAYCCLGVLACVSGEKNILHRADYDRLSELIGVDWKPLADLNDGKEGVRPHAFPEIADWIEKNIPASLPTALDGDRD